MAQLVAATISASTSSDFDVTSSSGVTCYGAKGSEFIGTVYQKNSDSTYSPLKSRLDPAKTPVTVTLDGINSAFTITQAGTYRIVKAVTGGTVGIDVTAAT